MLGLLLIFFIGKYFYKLAEKHNKSKWLYTILGIACYYTGTILAGFIIGIFYYAIAEDPTALDNVPNVLFGLIGMPFGLLACWGFYTIMKNRWEKEGVLVKEGISDIGADVANKK